MRSRRGKKINKVEYNPITCGTNPLKRDLIRVLLEPLKRHMIQVLL